MATGESCPFKPGDMVVYRPSQRGKALSIMDDNLPKVGATVRVARIEKGAYVVWEGCSSPGGGLHWTEFSAT